MKVEVLCIGKPEYKDFIGTCWNCDSRLSIKSASKIPLETVKCPVCARTAELRPPKEKVEYCESSPLDWLFRLGKPKILSDEY